MRTIEEICQGESLTDVLLKARLDIGFWFTRVLGKKFEWFHKEWVDAFEKNERSAVIAPRGHGKTHVLGVGYILWFIFYNENKEVLIVAPTKEQSQEILVKIQNEILDNELLIKLKSRRNVDGKWNKSRLQTSNKCTIYCKPYSSNTRGMHVDRILADEVAFFRDRDTFNAVISPMVNKKRGHIMAISTPISEGDLIMELNSNPEYNPPYGFSKRYQAITNIPEGGTIEQGTPLWESEYSMEKLLRIKAEIGRLKFNREYMCDPTATGTPIFPVHKLNAAVDPNLKLVDVHDGNFDREIYMGVDFGLSDAYEAGYTVLFAVEKTKDNKMVIRDIYRSKGMHPSAIESQIKSMRDKWAARQVWLDESTFGKNYLLKLQQDGVPVRGVTFTRENRNDLLLNLMKFFDEERVVIPYNREDDRTNYLCFQLIKELSSMSSAETKQGLPTFKTTAMFDDMVMSLALACYGAAFMRPILEYW